MSGRENVVLCASRAVVATVLLFSGPGAVAAEPQGELAHLLEAVVQVHAEIPTDARTAAYLGTQRDGAGVVIDDAGLVVTIGYLITEAMGAEVTTESGRVSRADVVGFDIASGLGLLRAAEPLAVKPMPIGTATVLAEKTPVMGDLLVLGRPSAPPRPWLGVNLRELDGKLVVGRVASDGPSDKAGVRHGDQVTAIDGARVHELADFYRTLWRRGDAGVTVRLGVTRHGEEREIEVETIDRYRYLKLNTTY